MEKTFAKGLRVERPKEGAPDFVKCKLGFKVDEFIEFLEAHKGESGWVNVDILSSKEKNALYAVLNAWKPVNATDPSVQKEYAEGPNPDEIPF